MVRINLYNYRNREIHYRKIRVFAILGFSIVAAALVNFFVFSYIEVQIMQQETRNSFLNAQIRIIDNQVAPIKSFEDRAKAIKKKIDLVNNVETRRLNSVKIIQEMHRVVPNKLYFTNVSILGSSGTADFRGVAAGPLFIAQFLDKLRESGSVFSEPILKSNDTRDQNSYNFEIVAKVLNPSTSVEFESDGN